MIVQYLCNTWNEINKKRMREKFCWVAEVKLISSYRFDSRNDEK